MRRICDTYWLKTRLKAADAQPVVPIETAITYAQQG
jgi:hypothetical protein